MNTCERVHAEQKHVDVLFWPSSLKGGLSFSRGFITIQAEQKFLQFFAVESVQMLSRTVCDACSISACFHCKQRLVSVTAEQRASRSRLCS